jgi:hypothetical protein
VSLFDRLKSSMAPKERHSGGIFVDFEIITAHVEGLKHEGFEIPKGGVIKAFQILNFYGEPLPISSELTIRIQDEDWVKGFKGEADKKLDEGFIEWSREALGPVRWSREVLEAPVKVESIKRINGLYQLETSPALIFDMTDYFGLDNFEQAWDSLDEMLINSVNLYREDAKFFNFSRSEF